MTILHLARLAGRQLGLEIQRADARTMPSLRLVKILHDRGLSTVIDVGANDGGYATDILDAGYRGSVVSFEPIPDCYQTLLVKARQWRGRWIVGPRVALSNQDATATFHVAANSVSSSLLEMTNHHVSAAPASATVAALEVKTQRLDTILPELGIRGDVFLKLDVQGAERMVLDGATNALASKIKGVQLEMSLEHLYEGQDRARELDVYLTSRGFTCWDIIPGFRDPISHRLLQYDGVYIR